MENGYDNGAQYQTLGVIRPVIGLPQIDVHFKEAGPILPRSSERTWRNGLTGETHGTELFNATGKDRPNYYPINYCRNL